MPSINISPTFHHRNLFYLCILTAGPDSNLGYSLAALDIQLKLFVPIRQRMTEVPLHC